jgi:hypothetical protein
MSRLDDLPPDQAAALKLLLSRRQSYAELAGVLNISERAVHDRAHAALAMLAPAQARALSAEQRDEIGDFLLGQQRAESERAATRRALETSAEARAWALAVLAELGPIGNGVLADMPGEVRAAGAAGEARPAAAPTAPATPGRSAAADGSGAAASSHERAALPVSRRAGAVLLAALVAAVVVGALAATGTFSGGSSKHKPAAASSGKSAETPVLDKRITLRPPEAGSHALGVVGVISEKNTFAIDIQAQGLAASKGFFYAVWLTSPTSSEALGKSPAVGSDGRLQAATLLPSNAASFTRIILTRETNAHPSKPGPVVLSGAFALH